MTPEWKEVKFRSFEEKDFLAVRRLHVNSFRELAASHYTHDQIEAHEEMFLGGVYLSELCASNITLALIGDEVVGSAGWCRHDPKTARIRKMFVSPSHSKRGIGRLLFGRIEKQVRISGLRELFLRASLNAVAFYERLGFEKVNEDLMHLNDGKSVPVMMMRKTLND